MILAQLDELVSVLTAQLELYGQLAVLSEAEREALIARVPDQVFDLVRRKETLLLRLRTIEESRELCCLRLARTWDLKAGELTLSEIQRRCPDEAMAGRLGQLREAMRTTIERIQKQNSRNAGLCHQGLELIGEVLQVSGRPATAERVAGGSSGHARGNGVFGGSFRVTS
jgi:flagellar biosynthesis/type III secretory pathway chaperone